MRHSRGQHCVFRALWVTVLYITVLLCTALRHCSSVVTVASRGGIQLERVQL